METRKALVVVVWMAKAGAPAEDRRVLVLRLTPERGGFWQTVTGKVEEGESFQEGALREAEEETGLRFERIPQYLGLEHRFDGRWGPAHEKCFLLPIVGGSSAPAPRLDSNEHVSFQWLPPADASTLVKFPMNKTAVERAASGVPPLFLSARGAFFQEGEEITHVRTAALLHQCLVRETGGAFKVKLGDEELDVVVEDTPRFVRSYDAGRGEIALLDGLREELDPTGLRVRADNSLVCRLQNGWDALFLSSAYYELAQDIRPGSAEGEYLLHFRGRDYRLGVPR